MPVNLLVIGIQLNVFELTYLYVHEYALYIGCALISIGLLIAFLRRRRSGRLLGVLGYVMALLGGYLILWNFRIINIPYRSPDMTAHYEAEAIKENQKNAGRVDFKTFNMSYTPEYVRSWTPIISVLLFTKDEARDPPVAEHTQVNIEYAKYLTGQYINSEVLVLSQDKPVLDIRKETTRSGSCTTSSKLNSYEVIGRNDAGSDILKGTSDLDTAYLTDYMGTRLILQNCHISGKGELTDKEALKMLHNLVQFDIKTANFRDPRT